MTKLNTPQEVIAELRSITEARVRQNNESIELDRRTRAIEGSLNEIFDNGVSDEDRDAVIEAVGEFVAAAQAAAIKAAMYQRVAEREAQQLTDDDGQLTDDDGQLTAPAGFKLLS